MSCAGAAKPLYSGAMVHCTQVHALCPGASLLLAGLLPASAQPAPRLNSLAPEWIQRGTTVEVILRGENLGGITRVIFDGDAGLTATNVPPVPAAQMKPCTLPSVWRQISGPVVLKWIAGLAGFLNCMGI